MYKIAVVDDDYRVIAEMTKIIDSFFRKGFIQEDFTDGYELINALSTEHYDIIFLDIEMKYVGGLKTIEEIRKHDPDESIYVVFISSHEDNLIPFFKYHPFSFLKKPISVEETTTVLRNIISDMTHKQKYIKLVVNRIEMNVATSNIVYAQSSGHNVIFYLRNDEELCSHMRIDDAYGLLNEAGATFLKIHTSYIINSHYVEYFKKDSVKINGVELPISRKYQKDLLLRLHEVL